MDEPRLTIFRVILRGCITLKIRWLNNDFTSIVTRSLNLHHLGWLTVLLNHLHRSVALNLNRKYLLVLIPHILFHSINPTCLHQLANLSSLNLGIAQMRLNGRCADNLTRRIDDLCIMQLTIRNNHLLRLMVMMGGLLVMLCLRCGHMLCLLVVNDLVLDVCARNVDLLALRLDLMVMGLLQFFISQNMFLF